MAHWGSGPGRPGGWPGQGNPWTGYPNNPDPTTSPIAPPYTPPPTYDPPPPQPPDPPSPPPQIGSPNPPEPAPTITPPPGVTITLDPSNPTAISSASTRFSSRSSSFPSSQIPSSSTIPIPADPTASSSGSFMPAGSVPSKRSAIGGIIGGVVAAVIVVLCIFFAALYIHRKRRRERTAAALASSQYANEDGKVPPFPPEKSPIDASSHPQYPDIPYDYVLDLRAPRTSNEANPNDRELEALTLEPPTLSFPDTDDLATPSTAARESRYGFDTQSNYIPNIGDWEMGPRSEKAFSMATKSSGLGTLGGRASTNTTNLPTQFAMLREHLRELDLRQAMEQYDQLPRFESGSTRPDSVTMPRPLPIPPNDNNHPFPPPSYFSSPHPPSSYPASFHTAPVSPPPSSLLS